jgi:hypothetical protein
VSTDSPSPDAEFHRFARRELPTCSHCGAPVLEATRVTSHTVRVWPCEHYIGVTTLLGGDPR